jgi:stage II sporulation protein D
LDLTFGDKKFSGKRIVFHSDVVALPSWSRIPAWDTLKRYNDNLFRSKIILENHAGKLLVVNELPIEDYLKGLGEVSNTDPLEKIKTITVAARTYAYHYIDPKNRKYQTKLYDGSDNPDEFQKYLGYGYELRSPNVSQAVRSTKGKVITYKDALIKAWYFSSSDGKTRSYREYCEQNTGKSCRDIPYLQSVEDPAGKGKTRSGHGVGISGIGATFAANNGKKYQEIIQYYLQ